MTLEDRLLSYYQDEQSRVAPPGAGISAAIARGRRRRRRRLVAETSVVAAFTVLAGTMLYQRVSTEPVTRVATPPSDADASKPFAWSVVDGDSPLGFVQGFVAVSGQLYALSTAPGKATTETQDQVLYTSSDGQAWAQHPLAGGLHLADLTAVGANLYAVGTAPATAGADAVMAASTDQGASWTTATVPVDRGGLVARGLNVGVGPLRLVTGANRTLVIATPYVTNPELLWSDGLAAEQYLQATAEGLTAQSKSGASATKTWAELGISAADAAIVRGTPQIFSTTDGTTFTRAALDADIAGLNIETAFSLGGDFYLEGHTWTDKANPPPATLLRSSDGAQWTTVVTTGLEDLQWASGADVINGQAVMLGNSGVYRSADGSSWTRDSLGALVGANPGDDVSVTGGVGPAGVVATVMVSPASNREASIAMKLDMARAAAANADSPVATPAPVNLEPPKVYLLSSRDGVTFDSVPLDQLVGRYEKWVDSVTVGANEAYVHIQVPSGTDKTTSKNVLLVGRPG